MILRGNFQSRSANEGVARLMLALTLYYDSHIGSGNRSVRVDCADQERLKQLLRELRDGIDHRNELAAIGRPCKCLAFYVGESEKRTRKGCLDPITRLPRP